MTALPEDGRWSFTLHSLTQAHRTMCSAQMVRLRTSFGRSGVSRLNVVAPTRPAPETAGVSY